MGDRILTLRNGTPVWADISELSDATINALAGAIGAAGGAVWGPDEIATPPTKPPIVMAGIDISTGDILPVLTLPDGTLAMAGVATIGSPILTTGLTPISVANISANAIGQLSVRGVRVPTHDDGAANVFQGAVSIGTTAAQIVSARSTTSTPRRGIRVFNQGSTTLFIGTTSTVTTANGYPIPAGASQEFRVLTALFGIVASGTADVRFFEEYFS